MESDKTRNRCQIILDLHTVRNLLHFCSIRLWQISLNFAVFCTSSACGVSSEHLNYTKHPMIRAVYCSHIYYHVGRVLEKVTGSSATRNWF